MSKEAKVGFLGILGLVLFFIAVPSSSTRDSKLLGNTYHLIMSEGDHINEGDPVKLAGISVGTIDKINFTTPEQRQTYGDDANIIVTVNADAGVRIPVDSVVDV
ncbi:MCE family protein, partial [bacterium]|nr:MCE family protein [bacterium]